MHLLLQQKLSSDFSKCCIAEGPQMGLEGITEHRVSFNSGNNALYQRNELTFESTVVAIAIISFNTKDNFIFSLVLLCVPHDCQHSDHFPNNIKKPVSVMETNCVFCESGTN
jgi:hypothetical protein